MRLLIIRFSSIGDIVLTTPVIRCVKQQIPGVEIHFLTKLSMKEVTEANPYIDHFHYLDQDINELIPTLKKQSFDAVIDLHHNQRTWRIKRALGVKAFSYKKLSIQKIILTTLGIDLLKKEHITKRYMDTVTSLGVVDDGKGLDYFIPTATKSVIKDLPENFKLSYVGLVIGASYFNKKLPFIHGARYILPDNKILIPSYHPSPRNVNRKIINTQKMVSLLKKAKKII